MTSQPDQSYALSTSQSRQLDNNEANDYHVHAIADNVSSGESRRETGRGDEFEAQNGTASNRIHLARQESNHHVNVAQAEEDFRQLDLQLKLSHSQTAKRTWSRKPGQDLEKGQSHQEAFDLESTLRGDRADAEESGAKFKRIGVIWKDLTVRGLGGTKTYVQTFPSKLISFINVWPLIQACIGSKSRAKEFDILKSFTGIVRPGEMVLVLGRPGSGCTSFLKVISNQRFGYTQIFGDVQYGKFGHFEFSRSYRGEAVYNAEDESSSMLPTLTVGQTLNFALDTKLPAKRPAGLTKQAFKDKVITMLLRMFNIEHTRDTMIGGMFVRGVSGGERKRAAIAEMMITNASVCAWDSPIRGLDASTAVDYVRSIRIFCDIHHTSTFITAYQVSESIYREFDKVLLIDEGRQVYFGPAKQARAYFEGLGFAKKPRQTTADYLTGCTDPHEREYDEEVLGHDYPSTPDQLALAYSSSNIFRNIRIDIERYERELQNEEQAHSDFLSAIQQSKRRTSDKNVYSIPFYLQVFAIMKRQYILKWQDKFSLGVSWLTMMLVGLVLSTVWVNLPQTSDGAFIRGGVIFISFLFNGFQAFGELAGTITGRPVVNKHRSYAFYRPSALWIAQIVVDMSFQSVVILAFSIMVYFSTGLARTPGAFFTFFVTILSGYLCMVVIFRTVGLLSADYDVVMRVASIIITFLVLTSGYTIQWKEGQIWLRWLFWINPAGLGFSTLMLNEFKRINLQCVTNSLIPSGESYDDINHQVCTLLGSVRGNETVSGRAYVETTFSIYVDQQWLYFGIILVLITSFLTANIILGEYITFGSAGRTVTMFVKEDSERRQLNAELWKKQEKRASKEDDNQVANIAIESQAILTWEGLNYDVPVPGGQRRILNDVYGYCKPGQLTALMGASGAGKTTLLDVLAARKNIGVISGQVLLDGTKPGLAFQRGTSYAEQMDVHEATNTVREALRFSANLRQAYEIPQAEKYAYVEEIISLLELESIADAVIGTPESGLSPDQRKLVTIGVELAAKPQLLLFLDEPTTGLDSQSAWNIARFLRKLTAAGQAVLCTIHQPNNALFQQFDRLLLLQKGGECVYFGELGPDTSYLRKYFSKYSADCPSDANPAEWMLDAIGAGLTPALGNRDWGEIWRQSSEFTQVKEEIVAIKKQGVGTRVQETQQEYATPMWHQMKHVVKRQSISYWRTPNYGLTRLMNHVTLALIAGLIYINLDDSRSSLQNRVFLIFQVTVLPALILAQTQPKYAMARSLSYKEQAAKTYQTIPFATSMIIAEMPYSILCTVCFFLPLYYIPGLRGAPKYAGYQFFMILIVEQFSVTLGQMLAALTPTPKLSALLNPPIMITFALFAGVTIPYPRMPVFWRSWLYYVAPFSHLISGMLTTELHDAPVVCRQSELQTFTAPPNSTCGSYMDNFFSRGAPGYLVSEDTSNCQYCAFRLGDQFYTPLGYDYSHRWRELGILSCYIFSTIAIVLIAARYLDFNKR